MLNERDRALIIEWIGHDTGLYIDEARFVSKWFPLRMRVTVNKYRVYEFNRRELRLILKQMGG